MTNEQLDQIDAHIQALSEGIRRSQLFVDPLIEQPKTGQELSTLKTAAKAYEMEAHRNRDQHSCLRLPRG